MNEVIDIGIKTHPVVQFKCTLCKCEIDPSGVDPFAVVPCPHCGGEQIVPARFGSFTLLSLLGSGGMGGVFLAHDKSLGRNVAIKVMRSELGDDAEFVANFRREAQSAAKLNHPNIAQIYSFGQEDGQPYIAMELVSGKHFDQMVDDESPLDVALVLRVGADIAEGLRDAADIGLTHGDIKPENILFDDKMQAKLVDFGIANFSENAEGEEKEVWGTPYYIAPESVKLRRTDARSDIYSLGATLYHALTGVPPFDGETPTDVVRARFAGPPPAPSSHRADLDPRIDAVIMRMLEQVPSRRYPTYQSLLADMMRILEELGPAPSARKNRVVIRPKRNKLDLSGSDSSSARGAIQVPRGSAASLSATTASIDPENRAGPGKVLLIIGIVVFSLLLIAGGTIAGIFLYTRSVAERLINELIAEQVTARTDAEGVAAQVMKAVAPFESVSREAEEVMSSATEIFVLASDSLPKVPAFDESAAIILAGTNVLESTFDDDSDGDDDLEKELVADLEDASVAEVGGELGIVAVYDAVYADVCDVLTAQHAYSIITQRVTVISAEISSKTNQALFVESKEKLANDATKATDLLSGAREALASAKSGLRELERLSETLAAEHKEAERLRLIREQNEAKAEALRQEEAALQAKRDAELSRVEREVTSRKELFTRNRYSQIVRELSYVQDDFTTDEGREAIAVAIERYQYLARMRSTIVDTLEDRPLLKGWREKRKLLDAVKADKLYVYIGDGRKILWDSVEARHMVDLIRHLISDDEQDRKEQCARLISASVFCYELSRESDDAAEYAKQFAKKALEVRPSQKAPIERLMPGIFD